MEEVHEGILINASCIHIGIVYTGLSIPSALSSHPKSVILRMGGRRHSTDPLWVGSRVGSR